MVESELLYAVWRLDGNISGMHDVMRWNGSLKRFDTSKLQVRPGFSDLLARLTKEYNFVHLGHSDFWPEHNEFTLEVTGLKPYFQDVVSKGDYTDRYAYPERHFMDKLGLSDDQARSRMIAVGSAYYDQPSEVTGMVFLEQDQTTNLSFTRRVKPIETVLLALLKEGEGSFRQGFERWYQQAEERPMVEGQEYPFRVFRIPDSIRMMLEYRPTSINYEVYNQAETNPTISGPGLF